MVRKVQAIDNVEPADEDAGAAALPSEQVDALDADEAEFRALRRDLPGVKGASATGIVAISVGKTPAKNEFFRTHREFRPIIPIVDLEVGMERQFFAVTSDMVENLHGIGISVTEHVLYLTVTSRGAIRIVPVRQANADGEQNEYHRTKEIGLVQAIDEWVRLYTDQENRCYKVFTAPAGRFNEPQWPELKEAKIFRLAFRDKGRLVDNPSIHFSRSGLPVIPTDLPFEEVWLHDFEFIPQPGERADVVCLAARELRFGQTLRLWRDQLGQQPPYRTDSGVLFVSFVANAECACHLSLGWPLPVRVLDLSPAFRNIVNGRTTPEGKGLIGALRYYGLDAIGSKQKDAMRERIMKGWPFTPEEKQKILDYCYSDIDALLRLLPKILSEPEFDLGIALYHGEFAAISASMEHRGVPIDMEPFAQLADSDTWRTVRDAIVPVIDADYGVYVRNVAGDWTFNMECFAGYLEREGILAGWPRTESGKLDTKRKTFDEMSKGWPQLEELRQLRHARDKMRKVKLAVGRDGRNRTVLWPFKAKTSRTQPKASQWIFSPAVWLRSLIKPEPGMAVAYVDYSSMEFLIAASLSDGHCGSVNTMLDMYETGDPYLSFAKCVGAVPHTATKASHAEVRDKYKTMLLAVQYGMARDTLAARLGVSSFDAHQMLNEHRELFAQYWQWSDDWMQSALQTGVMRTAFGWYCRTGITEFNERSIRNWPVQATGADILRIACILAARHGIRLLAPVHDAVLIEAPIDHIEADVALMREIMCRASRIVLNTDAAGSHELRTDCTIIRHPDSYSDKRGLKIWAEVMALLSQCRPAAMAAREVA